MSELFLEKIQEIGVDLTGKNRLRQVNEEESNSTFDYYLHIMWLY